MQVNDENGKNVGQIYVDGDNSKVIKVILNGEVLKDLMHGEIIKNTEQETPSNENSFMPTNTTHTTNKTPQTTIDNTTLIILAIASIVIIASAGYWFYNRK